MSSSRFVRSEVSGVRSSCPASATSRRCRSMDDDSAASIALKLLVRRAISSPPVTGIGRRSPVRATRSVAEISRSTGRSPARAIATPVSAASSDARGAGDEEHHGELATASAASGRAPGPAPAPGSRPRRRPRPGRARRRSPRCAPRSAGSGGRRTTSAAPRGGLLPRERHELAVGGHDRHPQLAGGERVGRDPQQQRGVGEVAGRGDGRALHEALVELVVERALRGEEHRDGDQRDEQPAADRDEDRRPAGAAGCPAGRGG